ncbi:hypothetical protein HMN09_00122000 [Mycena chlorophos]|uniref:DNA 3'-5' helicase n=1 Tax=Mycena chlorophos TaxID=658473 RepID=A0A8H6TVD3_MYCCL|nr:hypothetical protein HMN09_00122000 [Mycena chlorophos]
MPDAQARQEQDAGPPPAKRRRLDPHEDLKDKPRAELLRLHKGNAAENQRLTERINHLELVGTSHNEWEGYSGDLGLLRKFKATNLERLRAIRQLLNLECEGPDCDWDDDGDVLEVPELWLPPKSPEPASVEVRDRLQAQHSDTLKTTFGIDQLRVDQALAVDATLNGHDLFVLQPTGSGKSLIYQLPGVIEGALPGRRITIVVSPLVSLINDQATACRAKGIPVLALTAEQNISTSELRERIFYGPKDQCPVLLFVTPERIHCSKQFHTFLKELHFAGRIGRFAVDEAHCLLMWGLDFRESYLKLKNLREDFPSVPIVALTATATAESIDDICRILNLDNPTVVRSSLQRSNLRLAIEHKRGHFMLDLVDFIANKHRGHCGIVYRNSRKGCETLVTKLESKGIEAAAYHAEMSKEQKDEAVRKWGVGKKRVMVATCAFALGIDKPDVRFIIHYDSPKSVERSVVVKLPLRPLIVVTVITKKLVEPVEMVNLQTVYSVSRAIVSLGILINALADYRYSDMFASVHPGHEQLNQKTLLAKKHAQKMVKLVETSECIIKCLLRHFGEDSPTGCGRCSKCLRADTLRTSDFGEFADQAISLLRAVFTRTSGEKITLGLLASLLLGHNNEQTRLNGRDQHAAYSFAKSAGMSQDLVEILLGRLIARQVFAVTRSQGEQKRNHWYLKFGMRAVDHSDSAFIASYFETKKMRVFVPLPVTDKTKKKTKTKKKAKKHNAILQVSRHQRYPRQLSETVSEAEERVVYSVDDSESELESLMCALRASEDGRAGERSPAIIIRDTPGGHVPPRTLPLVVSVSSSDDDNDASDEEADAVLVSDSDDDDDDDQHPLPTNVPLVASRSPSILEISGFYRDIPKLRKARMSGQQGVNDHEHSGSDGDEESDVDMSSNRVSHAASSTAATDSARKKSRISMRTSESDSANRNVDLSDNSDTIARKTGRSLRATTGARPPPKPAVSPCILSPDLSRSLSSEPVVVANDYHASRLSRTLSSSPDEPVVISNASRPPPRCNTFMVLSDEDVAEPPRVSEPNVIWQDDKDDPQVWMLDAAPSNSASTSRTNKRTRTSRRLPPPPPRIQPRIDYFGDSDQDDPDFVETPPRRPTTQRRAPHTPRRNPQSTPHTNYMDSIHPGTHIGAALPMYTTPTLRKRRRQQAR